MEELRAVGEHTVQRLGPWGVHRRFYGYPGDDIGGVGRRDQPGRRRGEAQLSAIRHARSTAWLTCDGSVTCGGPHVPIIPTHVTIEQLTKALRSGGLPVHRRCGDAGGAPEVG